MADDSNNPIVVALRAEILVDLNVETSFWDLNQSDGITIDLNLTAEYRQMATGFVQRFKGKIAGTGDSQFGAGKSGASLKPFGNVSIDGTTSNSAATASAQTLKTYSIPANALDAVGRGVEVRAFGTKAGNAAPVNLGLTIGGVAYTMGNSTQSGVSWSIVGTYFKTAANAQMSQFDGIVGAVPAAALAVADTAIDTSVIVVNVRATDASAASSNAVCDGLIVRFFN